MQLAMLKNSQCARQPAAIAQFPKHMRQGANKCSWPTWQDMQHTVAGLSSNIWSFPLLMLTSFCSESCASTPVPVWILKWASIAQPDPCLTPGL